MTEEALALNRRHGDDCFQEHTVGRLVLARLRWRPQDADAAQLRGFAARYPHLPVWEAMLASLEWELGNVEAARRGVALCARDDFAAVARSPDFLPAAVCLAEAAAGAGRAVAGRAALRAAGAVRRRQPGAEHLWAIWGPAARGLGAARRGRRPPAATPPRTSPTRCGWRSAWGAPGWALRTIGDWLATGVPVPDRAELVNRGLLLARELGLPGVAARIADEAQTITP